MTGVQTCALPICFPVTIRTAFKRWFGDSKVVDENGKPLVVYHGTGFDFDVFEGARKGTEKAYFFAQSPELASDFALTSAGAYDGNANVMPVYLKMSNPLVIDYKGAVKWGNDRLMKQMLSQVWDGKYDGVIAQNVIDGSGEPTTIYAVITPNQVKSATGNVGTFDSTNPDIRYSLKEAPDTPEFKRFFGESKITNKAGKPIPLYHATYSDFNEFKKSEDGKLGAGVYLSGIPEYSESYATSGVVMPVWASVENPFVISIDNKYIEYESAPFGQDYPEGRQYPYIANVKQIEKKIADFIQEQTNGKTRAMDLTGEFLTRFFKRAGYDGILVKDEDGNIVEANVFDKSQLKSAIGNVGSYGERRVTEDEAKRLGLTAKEAAQAQKRGDLRFSLRQPPNTPEFKQAFGQSKVVNSDGKPMQYYHGTAEDLTEFKPGTANAIMFSPLPSSAEKSATQAKERLREQAFKAMDRDKRVAIIKEEADKALESGDITEVEHNAILAKAKRYAPSINTLPSQIEEQLPFS